MSRPNYELYRPAFQYLWDRMDASLALRNLADYAVLLKDDGKTEMPRTSKVILNYPRVFSDAVVAMLIQDTMDVSVTGADAKHQVDIEKWLKKGFDDNDQMLFEAGDGSLRSLLAFDICNLGWISTLPLVKYDPITKRYYLTVEHMNPRWMMWKKGPRGMEWTVNWIRINKEVARAKYAKINSDIKNLDTDKGPDSILAAVWDETNYSLFETEKGIIPSTSNPWFTTEHNLGFCPVKVEPCKLTPEQMTLGGIYATDLAQQGPDIFAPVMSTIKSMNEFASISATLVRQQFETPLAIENGEGVDLTGQVLRGYGITIPLKTGMKFIEIPTKEMSASAQQHFRELFNSWEMATLSSVNYGRAGDRQSALAIINLKGDNAKQLFPRRDAIGTMYSRIAYQFRRQMLDGKFYGQVMPADLLPFGTESLPIEAFKDKERFRIQFSFDSILPQEDIAKMQLYLEGKNGEIEEEWLARNILHEPDPESFVRKAKLQKLAAIVPADAIAQAIIELAPGDKPLQADINKMRIKIFKKYLKEMAAPGTPLSTPQGQGSPANLTKSASLSGSNKLAANEQQATGLQAARNATENQSQGV